MGRAGIGPRIDPEAPGSDALGAGDPAAIGLRFEASGGGATAGGLFTGSG